MWLVHWGGPRPALFAPSSVAAGGVLKVQLLRGVFYGAETGILQARIRRCLHPRAGAVAFAIRVAAHPGTAPRHAFPHAGFIGIEAFVGAWRIFARAVLVV